MPDEEPLVTQERLRELLNYDSETGVFTRLEKVSKTKVGDVFGYDNGRGYLVGMIDRRIYRLHQLAWFYANGVWATEIDHKNLDKADNRLENLRPATHSQNNANKSPLPNRTGFKGVSWRPCTGKYRASIRINGKQTHLGYRDTAEQAHQLYCEAAEKHYGEFARVS